MLERIGPRPVMSNGTLAPYSPVVRAGGFLFISGQLPFDPDRQIVPGGIEEHTYRCYENVRQLLASVGAELSALVKTTNYISRSEDFAEFNRVYASIFGDALPARSTVCVQLLMPAALEVDAIAYVGGS